VRITRAEVVHVARLARLALGEEEIAKYGDQISTILENVAVLDEVDTTHVPPTAQVTGLENVMRPDTTWQSLTQEEVLANAPRREGEFFRVQHIFEDGAPEDAS
jgi:aspartyl-tRNA(Asn)/glutamyl-tRNA(Gln) amidotransferase subunit C